MQKYTHETTPLDAGQRFVPLLCTVCDPEVSMILKRENFL